MGGGGDIKTCLDIVTIIETYNQPMFELQQLLCLAGSSHLGLLTLEVKLQYTVNQLMTRVITVTSAVTYNRIPSVAEFLCRSLKFKFFLLVLRKSWVLFVDMPNYIYNKCIY